MRHCGGDNAAFSLMNPPDNALSAFIRDSSLFTRFSGAFPQGL
jgi:hypothetical protein